MNAKESPAQDTAERQARRHRLALNLCMDEIRKLIDASVGSCDMCGAEETVYEQFTAGADPTVWTLCRAHHPDPSHRNIALDVEFAEFLADPQGPTFADHVRVMHEG
jgi:hypothetical protein